MEPIFKGRPIESWIEEYEHAHQHPVNRRFHLVGIPLIAFSLPLFVILLPFALWKVPAGLFALGWVFQLAGHVVEKKPPEFLKDARFLLVGLRWWLSQVFRKT